MSQLAEGVVCSVGNGVVVFNPLGTAYRLHLKPAGTVSAGPTVSALITAKARKVWTIAAGGSFIAPLVGVPRVIQGRVKAIEGNRLVVQAGTSVAIELPADAAALDLKNGPLIPGVMVNITACPDAAFTLAR